MTAVAAALVAGVVAFPAAAAPHGQWSPTGSWSGTSGTVGFAPAVGIRQAAVATTSTGPSVPSGASTWLGPTTPFGVRFGSTQDLPYLQFGTAASFGDSVTTVTFPSPTPSAGWGFTLGDSDAEIVTISAIGPGGALTATELGYQGVFNSCSVSPKPSGCPGGTSSDVPTWDPATATLTGNGTDTGGASAWFTPSVAVTSLTFTLSRISGFPAVNLWLSVESASVSGEVTTDGCARPEDATVVLQFDDGTAVLSDDGQPVVAVPGPDGTWSFPVVVASGFQVAVMAPASCEVDGLAVLPAPVDDGSLDGLDFTLVAAPDPPMPPTPGPDPSAGPGGDAGSDPSVSVPRHVG